MDKLSVVVCVDADRIELRGTSIELHARLQRAPVVPPVPPVPPVPIPPPPYVPIVIEGEQIPRTTWDDIQIDPARPYGTKPDFRIFRQDTR